MSKNSTAKIINGIPERSCCSCVKQRLCFIYRDVKKTIDEMEVPEDSTIAPGDSYSILKSLGNYCKYFQLKKFD